jgi:PAS domain S-box-containing protein
MSSKALPAPAKQLFRYLFEQASLGIAVEDLEGNLLLANPALCSMLGYTEKELCGMSCSEFANPEDSQDDWALFQQLRAGVIDHYSLEKRYLTKDGAQIWGRLNVSLSTDDDGGSPLVFAFVEEITERKLTEEDLARTNAQLRLALEAGRSVGWEWDLKTGRDFWFGDLQTMFGIPSHTFVGRLEDFYRYVHPDDRQLVAKAVADARQSQKPYVAEFRVIRSDGTVRWVTATGQFYYAANGDPERMLGMAADITERKLVEQALRESEARERNKVKELETILDAVPVPVLIAHDADCRRMTGNRAAYKHLRVAPGRNLSLSAPSEERPAFRQFKDGVEIPGDLLPMQEAAATGKPVYGRPLTMLFEDGTKREEVANAVPLLDDQGRPWGAVGASMDVTELKQAEEALRASEQKYRRVVDHLHDALMIDDAARQVIFANDRFLHLFGIDPAELKNIKIEDYVAPEFRDQLRDRHERRIRGESAAEQFEYEGIRRNGERIWLEVNVVPIHDSTGRITHTQSVIRDITERKNADAALTRVSRKLIQAQEQERTRIAGELHDDIGQRLAMLTIEIEELQQGSFDLPAEVRSRVDGLKKQTSEIATDIQSLSHELHSAKLEYLGMTAAMKGFCKEFGEQQKVDIDFQTNDLPSLVPPDVSLCFLRVLQEALHNSAKHSGARRFEVRLWGTSDAIHLTVQDSGAGFDPGAARMGRGLGLISMEERLKLLKGTLSIETEARRGTTIHARIPFSAESDSVRAAS